MVRYLAVLGAILYLAGCATAFAAGEHGALVGGIRLIALLALGAWTFARRSLLLWIFWSMLAGVEAGLDVPHLALHLQIISNLFLLLIKALAAPLILATLIPGIAAYGSPRCISRLALKSLVYFEALTAVALAIGLAAINLTRAGVREAVSGPIPSLSFPVREPSASSLSRSEFVFHLAKSIAENHMLQVAVFAVLFGLALSLGSEEKKRPALELLQSCAAGLFRLTNILMYLAPPAVGAALAVTVARSGLGILLGLGWLVATFYGAIAVLLLVGFLPAALLAQAPLRRFLFLAAEPATIAFATSSSEAALPIAMEHMEELGVPRTIVGFVIPTGYSFNLTGTALYLAVAAIFVTQSSGIHLSWSGQFLLLGTLMLTSKGVAGVPRAALVVLMATAASFHLPGDAIAPLLGVDALMDMGRTSTNVLGNCLASVVIARWERRFPPQPEQKLPD